MCTTSSEDLFICGKCHTNFTDLNIFLTHRSACVSQQTTNLCPISSCPLSTLYSTDIKTLVEDISSNLLSISDSLNGSNSRSSTSAGQIITSNETIDTSISDSTNYLSVENRMSEMTIRECPVCNEQFESQTVLENHVFEHSIWFRNDENIDSNAGPSVDDVSLSYNEDIDESLECKQCALTFTSKASFTVHKKMLHGLNPVFRCLNETCSQLFAKPTDYILHAQVHTQKHVGPPPSPHRRRRRRLRRIYRCKICKKTFQTSDQLEYHMQHEKHTFFCQLCSAEFEPSNSYHNHLAKHTELTLYHCTMCIKAFQKRTDLSRHIITEHNNDISDKKTCSICQLTFTARFHLKRHNATKHSDIKPFKCKYDGCQQEFARKDKLQQHEAKHSVSGGMYKCPVCSKTFVRPEHLRDHNITQHSHQYPLRHL